MALSDNIRAALLIMVSMTAFTVSDTLMKLAAPELPFFEQIVLRGGMICFGLYALVRLWGHMAYVPTTKDRTLTALRTTAEACGTVFFLTALYSMPLANLSAILQALPLTVTLAAALIFGESVGWRRIAAILVGFIGVTLIIRPGMDGFSIWSLYGLGAVAMVTLRDLAARKLSPEIPSSRVALSAAIGVTLMGVIGSLVQGERWVIPSAAEVTLLAGAAVSLMAGYIAAVSGMRSGDIGFVAPFRYTSLLVALIMGFWVFEEWPDKITLLGAAIVVATGLFTLYRERAAGRQPAQTSALSSKGLRPR